MMTCDEVSTLVDPFIDGELDSPRSRAVSAHLSECSGCHLEVQHTRDLRLVIAGAVEAKVKEVDLASFWTSLEGRLPATEQRRKPGLRERLAGYWQGAGWGVRMAFAGAAMAAVALIVLRLAPYSWQASETTSPPVVVASASTGVRVSSLRARGGTVAVWHEPRYDTTVIWVAAEGGAPW